MKTIELFEQAATKGNEFFRENNLNLTLYWAYRKSKQNGNAFIDFQEVIWEEDIEPIANFLKAERINEFTISSTFSSLISTLAAFEKQGFHMNGLTEVTADYTDFATGKPKIIHLMMKRSTTAQLHGLKERQMQRSMAQQERFPLKFSSRSVTISNLFPLPKTA